MVDSKALEDGDERRHVVAAIGIVRVDTSDVDELAFPVLDREQRGHYCLAFIIGRTEEIARIRDRLVYTVLGSAIPVKREGARLLDHWSECQPDAGRNDALYAVDLL